jgi:hypothetical protein
MLGFLAAVTALTACGAGGGAPSAPSGGLILGASVAYIGTTNACVLQLQNCQRAPATAGNFVTLSQSGNASNFQVSSADPTIAGGSVVMQGPGGQGDPAVSLVGYAAGTATLTVTGANGATASLPITITPRSPRLGSPMRSMGCSATETWSFVGGGEEVSLLGSLFDDKLT